MAKRPRQRLYWRERGGEPRYYADLRDYADVGGGREALVAEGEKMATTDPDVAQHLLAERVQALDAKRRGRGLHGTDAKSAGLEAFAAAHLVAKAKAAKVTDGWLEASQLHLERAVAHLGASRELRAIGVGDVRRWIEVLRATGLSSGTIHHHLATLSNLFRRAQSEEYVAPGYNPVAALLDKPKPARREAAFLEVPDAALLLEAARRYQPARPDLALPCLHALLATLLLTGGRRSEVLGLEVDDVNFARRTVTFRPNARRGRLKNDTSWRAVPLWPQLEEILRAYVFADGDAREGLLFPGTSASGLVGDFRKLLDQVAASAGFLRPVVDPATGKQRRQGKAGALLWTGRRIRPHMLRHTYCAARLQTLDRGEPVSQFTVGRELGHGGDSLVKRVYGHLGDVRHRAEVVEYRVEQHRGILGRRLTELAGRFGTTVGTTDTTDAVSR